MTADLLQAEKHQTILRAGGDGARRRRLPPGVAPAAGGRGRTNGGTEGGREGLRRLRELRARLAALARARPPAARPLT